MMKYIFMLIFAVLPFFSWYFQKYFAKKSGRYELLLKHWTVRYDDFVLIGFNAFIPFWLDVILVDILVIIIICFILQMLFHWFWAICNKKNNLIHFYYKKSMKLNGAGFVHLLFSVFEMTFMVLWLISTSYNIFFLISGLFLIIFTSLMFVGSKKINGRIELADFLMVTILLILIVVKLGLYLF